MAAFASGLSFHAHVYLDREYHVEGRDYTVSPGLRKQRRHSVHHLHANTNFAVIDFFETESSGSTETRTWICPDGFPFAKKAPRSVRVVWPIVQAAETRHAGQAPHMNGGGPLSWQIF
jgi:hypothetical protein